FLLSVVIGGARWWIVLKGIGAAGRLMPIISLFWIGMLFSQILPSTAGDGVRVWLTVRRGYPLEAALNSVFLERISMLLMLLVMVVVTEPLLARRVGLIQFGWLPVIALLGGVAGLGLLTIADRLAARFNHWWLVGLLARLSADTRRIAGSGWALPLVVLTLLANLNFVVAGTLTSMALGLALSFYDNLLFIPLVVVATVLPISV